MSQALSEYKSVAIPKAYDLEACRELMRGGSKSFFAASKLLPTRLRPPAIALYAYCRLADDAIDLGHDPKLAMQDLQHRLDEIYEGRPGSMDADRALAHVVHRYGIPRGLLDALLDGFLWDTQDRRYETLADVEAYGARVAGTVGAMMSIIMGASTDTAIARACEMGVAMQLTNIARDVGEDARNGRLYLPRAWFREIGMDVDAWLANPVFDARIAGFTQRLLLRADVLYRRGEFGLAELVGLYLVFATLVIPALATFYRQHHRLRRAYAIGVLGYAAGLFASAAADLPSGPMIVCSMALVGALWALAMRR